MSGSGQAPGAGGDMSVLAQSWQIASDATEVHDLLLRCDVHRAATTGTGVPNRSKDTTRRRVEAGEVLSLRRGPQLLAAITLTVEPPFTLPPFMPPSPKARYISRLCVEPEELAAGTLVGIRCVRKALEVAQESSADVARSEANPDIQDVWTMLTRLGFEVCGPVIVPAPGGGNRRGYLEKRLR